MRLTCRVRFYLDSVSHWSGVEESCAQPILGPNRYVLCEHSHIL